MKVFSYLIFIGLVSWAAYIIYLIITNDDGLIAFFARIFSIIILLVFSTGLLKETRTTEKEKVNQMIEQYETKSFWHQIILDGVLKNGVSLAIFTWTTIEADFSKQKALLSSFLDDSLIFPLIIGFCIGWGQWRQGKKEAENMYWDKV